MSATPLDPFGRPAPASPDQPEDLAANRAGALTDSQKTRLRARLMPDLLGGLFGAAVLGGVVLCFAPTMLTASSEADAPGWLPVVFIGMFLIMLVGIGRATVWGAGRPLLALLDLNAGRVETADGRLVWQRREYRGLADGRTLNLMRGDERLPGAYRFYFLPRSGLLLSADPLGLTSGELDPMAELRRALGEVFDFHPEDLPDNKAGRLSERQTAGHWWAFGRQALFWLVILGPFVVGFGLMMPYAVVGRDLLAGRPVPPGDWVAALLGPAFALIFGAFIIGSLITPLRDLLRGEVQTIEGDLAERVIVTGSGRSRTVNYYYEINGQRFRVPAHALQASLSGRRYRLYYLPRSRNVVSAEPI